MVKIHLWNLIENHQSLDILEPSIEGEFKIVNSFEIPYANSIENLQEKIFVYLSSIIVSNWSNEKCCKFCFNKNVDKQNVDNYVLLECKTCLRIYEYNSSIDSVALPVSKYQMLWNNRKQCLTHSINNIEIVLPFIDQFKFSYNDIKASIILDLREKLEELTFNNPVELFGNKSICDNEINLFLYQDFELLLKSIETPGKTKYQQIFYPQNNKPVVDFINDNNTYKELVKKLTTSDDIIKNFEQIKPEIVLEQELSKMIIQHNQDSQTNISLLELFHLFEVSTHVPHLSLYIPQIDEKKHKVYRPFQNSGNILEQWLTNKKKGQNMILHLVYKEYFLMIILSPYGGIKIILPFSKGDKTDKTIIRDIIKHIHLHLKSYNIELPPKSINDLDFQTIHLDLFKFDIPLMNIKELGKLAKCLSPYVMVDQIDGNLNLFYIKGIDNQEMFRMDKFIWKQINTIYKNREFSSYEEDLKINLGDEFNLEGEHLDFIFRNWLRENAQQIDKQNIFRPIKNGIFIQIIPNEEVFRINVRGIQKWKQIEEIVLFLEKFVTIMINPPPFFQKQCSGIKISKSKTIKQPKFSKILKTNLPELFNIDNFTTHCQNERQPLIFKDKLKYENWMKEQMVFKDDIFKINDKEYDSRVFTRNCQGLPKEKLIDYQKQFNTTNCVTIQQKIFNLKNPTEQLKLNIWTKDEINTILSNLGLNADGNYDDNIKQIQRYFAIRKKIIQDKIEDVNPYPNTMIIKQNQQNFYLTCPNNSTKANNQKQIFMGFLQLDKHPKSANAIGDEKRKWCIPCCTKKVQGKIKEKLNDFCFGLIDYDEFLSKDNGNQSDYILNVNKFPLQFGRFGKLDNRIAELLKSAPAPDNVNNIEEKTFLRLGIPQSNHSFISSVLTAINFENTEKKTISDVYELLKQKLSEKLYHSLNSGNLLMTMDTYKSMLNIEYQDTYVFQEIWEFISLPEILVGSGLNIIIFEKVGNEIYIVCPEDQEIQHFYNPVKPSIILYKQEKMFEPIVFIENNKTKSLIDIETKSFSEWYLNSCKLQEFPQDWTAKSMVTKKTKYQIVDSFNKVMYLVGEEDLSLPVIPSGIIYKLPIKKQIVLKSYNETIAKMPSKYIPKNVIINEDEKVFGIVVQFDLIIPIIPEEYDKQKMLPIRKDLDIYDKVNEAILKDIKEYDYLNVKKKILMEELYQRIRFEYSYHQDKTIEQFFNENILIKDIDLTKLKNYIVPNIRYLCKNSTKNSIHCQDGKIILPNNIVQKFKTKLINEMKNNRQKRREIIEKDISPIIDLFRFVDSKNVKYY